MTRITIEITPDDQEAISLALADCQPSQLRTLLTRLWLAYEVAENRNDAAVSDGWEEYQASLWDDWVEQE